MNSFFESSADKAWCKGRTRQLACFSMFIRDSFAEEAVFKWYFYDRNQLFIPNIITELICGLQYGNAKVFLENDIRFKKRTLQVPNLNVVKRVRLATLSIPLLLGQVLSFLFAMSSTIALIQAFILRYASIGRFSDISSWRALCDKLSCEDFGLLVETQCDFLVDFEHDKSSAEPSQPSAKYYYVLMSDSESKEHAIAMVSSIFLNLAVYISIYFFLQRIATREQIHYIPPPLAPVTITAQSYVTMFGRPYTID